MTELVRFPLDGGGSVSFEVDELPGMANAGPARTVITEAAQTFERAFAEVRDAASAALGQLHSMAHRPDEIEIKFAVKLDAQVGAVVAKTGVQGQLEIKLKWASNASTATEPEPAADQPAP